MRHLIWLIAVIGCSLLAFPAVPQQAGSPGTETPEGPERQSAIRYPSVAAALEDLRGRRDVDIRVQDGWTIVGDRAARALWSFTPPDHPAHPAAVKRTIVNQDGAIFIEMGALCQAEKAACDKLMAEFEELNEKIRESMSA